MSRPATPSGQEPRGDARRPVPALGRQRPTPPTDGHHARHPGSHRLGDRAAAALRASRPGPPERHGPRHRTFLAVRFLGVRYLEALVTALNSPAVASSYGRGRHARVAAPREGAADDARLHGSTSTRRVGRCAPRRSTARARARASAAAAARAARRRRPRARLLGPPTAGRTPRAAPLLTADAAAPTDDDDYRVFEATGTTSRVGGAARRAPRRCARRASEVNSTVAGLRPNGSHLHRARELAMIGGAEGVTSLLLHDDDGALQARRSSQRGHGARKINRAQAPPPPPPERVAGPRRVDCASGSARCLRARSGIALRIPFQWPEGAFCARGLTSSRVSHPRGRRRGAPPV